jgi:hypothetical protein
MSKPAAQIDHDAVGRLVTGISKELAKHHASRPDDKRTLEAIDALACCLASVIACNGDTGQALGIFLEILDAAIQRIRQIYAQRGSYPQ